MRDVIVIERLLLRSDAFRSLNGTAKTVYLDFLMKRKMKQVKMSGGIKVHMILNNGELQYSYREALEKGITRPVFARAIDALNSHGFLDIAKLGSGGRDREVSLYAISERWRKWGTPEFDSGQARVKDNRKGRGFSVYWQRKTNAIFGNENVTGASNENVTPNSDFNPDFKVSSNENVTPKKTLKRRKGSSVLI